MRSASFKLASCALLAFWGSAARAAPPQTVTILHTNDWQSGLTGVGPDGAYTPHTTGDDPTQGGVARMATLIDQLRAAAEGPVLLLDGGDVTMGTLYHTVSRETGTELQLMRLLDYDAVTLGNHEFDFRTAGFGRMVASAQKGLGLPPLVATNLDLRSEHPDLEILRKLYAQGVIERTRIVQKKGLTIGLAGVLGVRAQEVMEAGTPVKITAPIAAAQKAVQELRPKVDLMVLLSHSGVERKEDNWGGEEVELMKAVPDIDVIVGGHSHTALHKPILVKGRPILQAGADTMWLGELVLKRSGKRWKVHRYTLHPLDDQILGRADVTEKIEQVKTQVDARILAPLGYHFDQVIGQIHAKHTRALDQHVIGNLVTDAMRAATGAQIAVTGNGTLRADLYPGKLRVSDIFRISGLGVGTVEDTPGFALVKLRLDGPSLKSVLEFLLVGYTLKGPDYYPRLSGLRVEYNPLRIPFDQIIKVELGSEKEGFKEIDLSDRSLRVSVTASTYIAKFLPQVEKLSYGILSAQVRNREDQPIGTSDLRGVLIDTSTKAGVQELKDWRVLVDYVAALADTDGDGVPNIPERGYPARSRLIPRSSIAPNALFKGTTWRARSALAIVFGLALLALWALRAAIRRARRKRGITV